MPTVPPRNEALYSEFELSQIDLGAAAKRAGIRLIELDDLGAKAQMPVAGNTQPHGSLNGGATALLVETVASVAANERARALGKVAVGTNLSVSHLAGASEGAVVAQAQLLRPGNSSLTYRIEVFGEDGTLVSAGMVSCRLVTPQNS